MKDTQAFQKTVRDYYHAHGRHDLPWRMPDKAGLYDPYKIIVSELMLQQTQVPRVIPKFIEFTRAFPSFASLSQASLADVLKVWSGLGYNRRAKFLHQLAQIVQKDFDGNLPRTSSDLIRLPGIGPNTAGAILAYAFNRPTTFIETNIRSVFIHHFFPNTTQVADQQLLPFIEKTALNQDPRTWHWALMDYGTHIKKLHGNTARRSTQYSKQSVFVGSRRQIRGRVLRELANGSQTFTQLAATISDERLSDVLNHLKTEALIDEEAGLLFLHL